MAGATSTSWQKPSLELEIHKRNNAEDIEGTTPTYIPEDPYSLASKRKTEDEIDKVKDHVKANSSKKRDGISTAWKIRKVQQFYEDQNESIDRFLKPVDEHVRQAREVENSNKLQVKIAIWASFVANVLLTGLQLYAAITSGSLSLWTTMADAIFDPLSNVTLIVSNRAVKRTDARKFPSGRSRIETVGNIVFCFVMNSVSWILIVVSSEQLARGETAAEFHIASVVAVAGAFTVKLALFLYCWALRNQYSQIRILWEDHRNDLFINGFGLMTSVLGAKLVWWFDPLGAIVLSCLISILWLHTAFKEFQLLIGVTADPQMLQWITYISMTHSEKIKAIDTVRAYHSGPRIIVEVDVVIDPEETVREAHDTAEELQIKLESLPDVERAYVHIDFETSHKPEHSLKKEL
ncbi:MAG: hypothetical protein GOMPHAMPRED_008175 [Gomphillus americanus]|uniref:Cation diffusion facilitator 1 n=1 Tax=Gomphillus americanus TaxID=1940652 RepID=A0A8H3IG28_9LECA|nr:MAG: hypothetical protein GOMPHAMPRED_008175 [Gomphillus americanus]